MIIYEIFHKSQVKKNEFWFSYVFCSAYERILSKKLRISIKIQIYILWITYAKTAYRNPLKSQEKNRNLIPVPIFNKIIAWKKSPVENRGFS